MDLWSSLDHVSGSDDVAMKRETFAQQLGDPLALRLGNGPVHSVYCKLAAARFALMILLPMAGMAIFLVPGRSTCWAGVSDEHGCC